MLREFRIQSLLVGSEKIVEQCKALIKSVEAILSRKVTVISKVPGGLISMQIFPVSVFYFACIVYSDAEIRKKSRPISLRKISGSL